MAAGLLFWPTQMRSQCWSRAHGMSRISRPFHRRTDSGCDSRLCLRALRSVHPCGDLRLQPHFKLEKSRRDRSQCGRRDSVLRGDPRRGQGPHDHSRDASATDPPATLFANASPSNRNIRLRDMSISWTDSSRTYDWVSIFTCHRCDQLELDHLSLEGNPNKLVNLLDSTGSSVHDNCLPCARPATVMATTH